VIVDHRLSANFLASEFACRCGCGQVKVDQRLVDGLQALRGDLGRPILVTSGYRCSEHNARVGGAANSQHVLGRAADIRVPGMTAAELYAAACQLPQFSGFGRDDARGFLHVDVREHPARWCYLDGRQAAWTETA
jgi:uncharacterized protein YcbK (DUF882 family)